MKIYCGDYMNYKTPRRHRWGVLGIVAACLLFTSAATPAMINYYWNGQNGTKNLALEEAIRMAGDPQVSEMMRKDAQVEIYLQIKRAIQALREADRSTPVLDRTSVLLFQKIKKQIEED